MNPTSTRSTIYFEPDLHKTVRLKAASTHRSVSALVNEAVRQSLAEDQEYLSVFGERVAEPTMTYEALQRASLAKSNRRQVVPADASWDVWFDGPTPSDDFMRERGQPAEQKREAF